MALNTTTGTGTQATTGTPQNVGAPTTAAAKTGSVQPGTATNLLTSSGGLTLNNSSLTTVDLNAAQTSTTQATTTSASADNNVNPVALGFCGLLLIAAIVTFAVMSRSAKNTT